MDNIFLKIINREIPADIIYEDDISIAFNDISPQAPTNILVIPKKEIPTVNDISDNDKKLLGEMFIAAKKVAKLLKIDKNGYRLIFNCNEDAGQTVFHIHMHLIGGRKFKWPPG